MKAILFNLHDVLLMLTIGLCAVLGIVHYRQSTAENRITKAIASLFFGSIALELLYALLFWGETLRYRLFFDIPYAYMLLHITPFLAGPLLYGYTLSSLNAKYTFRSYQAIHFVPALASLIYLYAVCFRFPPDLRASLFIDLQIYEHPFYRHLITLEKLIPLTYAFLSARQLLRNKAVAKPEPQLVFTVFGFTALWLLAMIAHLAGTWFTSNLSDVLGILGNYLTFILLSVIIYQKQMPYAYTPTKQTTTESKPKEENTNKPEQNLSTESIDKVNQAMLEHKVYLNSQLTLERFAQVIGISPREASAVINRHFKQNFSDFINSHRVDEVKKRLVDPEYANQTIPEIALASGFNSKATFNRFFKKFMQITPSEFRQAASPQQPTDTLDNVATETHTHKTANNDPGLAVSDEFTKKGEGH